MSTTVSGIWPERRVTCNIIFIKVPKCGSSTNGGIARRIGRHYKLGGVFEYDSEEFQKSHLCRVHANHVAANEILGKMFQNSEPRNNTNLYTFLRDPGKRALSEYFHFQVSRGISGISDSVIIPALNETRNKIFHYIKPYTNTDESGEGIRSILETYDFIGLVEREEESLVAMKILWNLNMRDILFINSKSSGSYDDTGHFIYPATISPKTESFIAEGFREKNLIDFQLYEEVHRKLDATIKRLGSSFHIELKNFQSIRRRAEEKCQGIPNFDRVTGRPTNPADRNCLWNDNGCAYTCLDTV